MQLSLEEENKILRASLAIMLKRNGLELSNDLRHSLVHLSKEVNLPKEKVFSFVKGIVLEHVDFILNPKNPGGH